MEKYKIYLAGTFIETKEQLNVINPYTNSVVAKTFLASEAELTLAIRKANEIMEKLKEIPSYKKKAILLEIASEIEKNKKYLAEVLCLESAKPIKYAIAEVERSVQTFSIAAEEAMRLPKEYISLDWTPSGENKEGIIKSFPIGLVAGIAPFNFPLNLAVHKIAPAIASACPIILKPASSTPLSTLELAKIIDKTDLPKGAVSILPCSRETGNELVTNSSVKLLSFTGSPAVGWKMKENSGKKKVVLELGGNAAVIVSRNCNIEIALKQCVYGAFAYSGQICIHAQRFFVAEEWYNYFVEKFVEQTTKLVLGNPMDGNTDFSVMIDEENAKRVGKWVIEAIEAGAKKLMGGKRTGNFMEPTILTNTNIGMKVNAEEVFGPIVCIEKVKNIPEAIEFVNNSRYGLQCGVFTNSIEEIDLCFNKLEVGGVILNDVPTYRIDHAPYGGIKDSGLGREGVKYAIQDMMETKILIK